MSEGLISLTIPEYMTLSKAQDRYDRAFHKMCVKYAEDCTCDNCDLYRITNIAGCNIQDCTKYWYYKMLNEVDDGK